MCIGIHYHNKCVFFLSEMSFQIKWFMNADVKNTFYVNQGGVCLQCISVFLTFLGNGEI